MRGLPAFQGPVTAFAAHGSPDSHLASIEKLSNGYIVRFMKPQKVTVKPKAPEELLGLNAETMGLLKAGLEHIKDLKEGETWKDEAESALAKPAPAPMEKWVTVAAAVACKNEEDLLAAIREAVVHQAEIEKLFTAGEFGPGIY